MFDSGDVVKLRLLLVKEVADSRGLDCLHNGQLKPRLASHVLWSSSSQRSTINGTWYHVSRCDMHGGTQCTGVKCLSIFVGGVHNGLECGNTITTLKNVGPTEVLGRGIRGWGRGVARVEERDIPVQ